MKWRGGKKGTDRATNLSSCGYFRSITAAGGDGASLYPPPPMPPPPPTNIEYEPWAGISEGWCPRWLILFLCRARLQPVIPWKKDCSNFEAQTPPGQLRPCRSSQKCIETQLIQRVDWLPPRLPVYLHRKSWSVSASSSGRAASRRDQQV